MEEFGSPEEYWASIEGDEDRAREELGSQLEPWRGPLATFLACAVSVPVNRERQSRGSGARIAGLFMRRALNDLWIVWKMLSLGYTPQAAAVAASAFESALLVFCLENHDDRADKFWESRARKLPWSNKQLCIWTAEELMAHKWMEPRMLTDADLAKLGDGLYTEYEWLCKYKHPTPAAAVHDAMGQQRKEASGEAAPAISFAIRIGQDARPVDLANKSLVLFIALKTVYLATLWKAMVEGIRWPDAYSMEWSETILRVAEQSSLAFDACAGPLAFDHAGFIPMGYQGHHFALGIQDRQS